jgi:hypothetical protein
VTTNIDQVSTGIVIVEQLLKSCKSIDKLFKSMKILKSLGSYQQGIEIIERLLTILEHYRTVIEIIDNILRSLIETSYWKLIKSLNKKISIVIASVTEMSSELLNRYWNHCKSYRTVIVIIEQLLKSVKMSNPLNSCCSHWKVIEQLSSIRAALFHAITVR